jgi:hypothetical protein
MIPTDTTFARARTFLNDDGRIVLIFEGVLEVLMTISQTDVIASRLFEVAQSARLQQAKREMAAQLAKLDGLDRPERAPLAVAVRDVQRRHPAVPLVAITLVGARRRTSAIIRGAAVEVAAATRRRPAPPALAALARRPAAAAARRLALVLHLVPAALAALVLR